MVGGSEGGRTPAVDISVIIPVYNEEENIAVLVERLCATLDKIGKSHEIIFIDDGSVDGTVKKVNEAIATHPEIALLKLSRNFGQHAAAQAGFDYCRGAVMVWLDADLQEPPEDIPKLLEKINEGYDFVYGLKDEWEGSMLKRASSKAFVWLFNSAAHINLPTNATTMRAMSRRFVDSVNNMPERVRFLAGLNAWVGFKSAGTPIKYTHRHAGESKYNLLKMLRLAFDGLLSFSVTPLRVITAFGFLVSTASFLFMLVIIFGKLAGVFGGSGWASVMVSLFFMGGVQCVFMGLIGEYVGRIYLETKSRPIYVVEKVYKGD
jgi:dolichol-phosphate mannosyltransferase